MAAGAVALLLTGCTAAPVIQAREAPPPPRTLRTPRFAWPDTLDLEVSRQARRAESVNGKRQLSEGPRETWRWTFRRTGGHALLRMVEKEGSEAEPWSLELAADARISRVDGLEGADRQPLLQLWAHLVGLWKDRDLELGQAYRQSHLQLLARKLGPCPGKEDAEPTECIWLETLIEMEESHFKDLGEEAARGFLQGVRDALPELSELPVRILAVLPERQTELVTETESLVPRVYIERTYLRVEIQAGEESEPIVSEVMEETRWTFRRLPPGDR